MKQIFGRILEILPYSIVFLFSIRFPIEPDLGWHLKQGEYFVQNLKIMDVNIYASELQNYQYLNYSWVFDAFSYLIFNYFSFWGLIIVGAISVTFIFYFFSKAANLNFWQKAIIFPIIIYLVNDTIIQSLRGQNLSLLFIGIIIYLLTIYDKYPKKVLIFTPLIMILWTNIHASSIIGLIIITIWLLLRIITDIFTTKKVNIDKYKLPFLLLIISGAATLVNPYTYKIYLFSFQHFNNPDILSKIVEWTSPLDATISIHVLIAIYIIYFLSLFLLIYKKMIKKEYIFFILLPIPFLVQSLMHNRYLWISAFLLIPLMGIALETIKPKRIITQQIIASIILVAAYMSFLYFFPIKTFIKPNWNTYCSITFCSSDAAEYIIENNLTDNLLTEYGHGGWIIWNFYPDLKPSIDGRMTVWRDKNGHSPFLEQFDLLRGAKGIEATGYDSVVISNIAGKRLPIYKEMQDQVKEDKWEIVYEDFYMIVFSKL